MGGVSETQLQMGENCNVICRLGCYCYSQEQGNSKLIGCATDLKHVKAPMNLNENLIFMIMIINNE